MVVSTKLTAARAQELKAILEGMEAGLNTRLQARKGEMREIISPVDRPHREDSTVAHSVELAFAERDSDTLHEVERALLRIKAGTYGRCTSCKDPIAYKRLKAKPTVGNCKECAEQVEASESSKRPVTRLYPEVMHH